MAKKTFKENPALRFVTTDEDTHNEQNTEQTHITGKTSITNNAQYTDNTNNKQERKTKRLNLLVQPSILENISKIAHMKQTSVNDLISSVLRDYAETEEEAISLYNKVFLNKEKGSI